MVPPRLRKRPATTRTRQRTRPTRPAAKRVAKGKAQESLAEMQANAAACGLTRKPHWPAEFVPNPRASSATLPPGWICGVMPTRPSGRGSGGKLHRCFVGPPEGGSGPGKLKWHKKDLEEYIGYTLPEVRSAPGARRGARYMTAQTMKDFPPEAILQRTEKQDAEKPVLDRCDRLDGKTVNFALREFRYTNSQGKEVEYRLSDLRYDIRNGNIRMKGKAAASSAKAAASSPKAAASSSRTTASSSKASRNLRAPKSSSSRKSQASRTSQSPKSSVWQKPLSIAPKAKRANPDGAQASSPAKKRALQEPPGTPQPGDAKAAAADVMVKARRQAISSAEVFVLRSAATTLRLDSDLVETVIEHASKPPRQRGDWAKNTLRELEKKLGLKAAA